MKVKDLIKQLEGVNPEAEVIVSSSNFEMNYASVSASHVNQYAEGSRKTKTFRDAFDGGSYDAETWSPFGGDLPVVTIS